MPQLTIGRMAKLYGLHRSSLYEAVDRGRVSAGFNGKGERVIDLAEMIRVYGEPLGQPDSKSDSPTPSPDAIPAVALQPLLDELKLLREEVQGLRQELLRIEHQPQQPSPPPRPRQQTSPPPEGGRVSSFADIVARFSRRDDEAPEG